MISGTMTGQGQAACGDSEEKVSVRELNRQGVHPPDTVVIVPGRARTTAVMPGETQEPGRQGASSRAQATTIPLVPFTLSSPCNEGSGYPALVNVETQRTPLPSFLTAGKVSLSQGTRY